MAGIPHTSPGDWPGEIGSGRFAASIEQASGEGCRVALLGLADDTGVKLNGGREGAAEGADAIRGALARYGTARPPRFRWPRVFDAGNVVSAGEDIHETHRRVSEASAALLAAGLFPIGLGGGHDLTYPFVRAVIQHTGAMSGVYFDAHLDVREEVGSGMPFRRLVEDCGVRELYVHGLDRYANSSEHMAWFQGHGGRVDPFDTRDPWPEGDLFVSFDLDVMDAAHAPGVSAPNPCGWGPERAMEWVRSAGRQERVLCFDVMELCPRHDADGRTARLAARLLLAFLEGFAERRS